MTRGLSDRELIIKLRDEVKALKIENARLERLLNKTERSNVQDSERSEFVKGIVRKLKQRLKKGSDE